MTVVGEKDTSGRCVDPRGRNKSLAAIIVNFLIIPTNSTDVFL